MSGYKAKKMTERPNSSAYMTDSTTFQDGAPRRRAFRRSCDRCHTQKLKCLVSGNGSVLHAQCQRCHQAGLRCVYSQRLARRTLRKKETPVTGHIFAAKEPTPSIAPAATTDSFYVSSTPSSVADMPQTPPLRHTDSFVCKDVNTHESTEIISFPDKSVDIDDLLSFPNCWSPLDFNDCEAVSNESVVVSDFGDDLGLSLNAFSTDGTTSPAAFDPQYNQPASNTSANTANTQRELSDNLLEISKEMEAILHGVTARLPTEDIWKYPIGKFLTASSKLLANVKQYARTDTNDGILAGCFQTKNLFMAVHCYILSVKIAASLAESLLSQLLHLQERTTSDKSMRSYEQMSLQGVFSNSDNSNTEFLFSFRSNLLIGELFSHINPLMHTLSAACATLQVNLRLLREIEVALGIPLEQGIIESVCRAESTLDSPSTPYQSLIGKESTMAPASRVLDVIWSNNTVEGSPMSSCALAKPIETLRRSYKEVTNLARKHNKSFFPFN